MLKKLLFAINVTALALTILFQPLETRAAWGDFDTSFGFQGVTVDAITGYYSRSVAIQPDGKILVTGLRITPLGGKAFFLRRYLSDGQLDTAFGTNGAAIGPETNFIKSDYRGDKIVVQANGKIAVSGWANGIYAVWQFSSSGIKDRTFGENGLQRLINYLITANSHARMNIQSGKLLLSLGYETGGECRLVLLRLNSSGTLDATFGSGGEAITEISGCSGNGTVVETNGKITVSGVKPNEYIYKTLERRLANGQPDSSFFPVPSTSIAIPVMGLVKMVNGKYATRVILLGNNGSQTLTLDKFSSAGVFESNISPYNGYPIAGCPEVFTNQNDGKLILDFAGLLFRLNSELDGSSIETNGCSNLSGMTDFARAAIQTDDKMVVAGVYNNYLMLVRLLPD